MSRFPFQGDTHSNPILERREGEKLQWDQQCMQPKIGKAFQHVPQVKMWPCDSCFLIIAQHRKRQGAKDWAPALLYMTLESLETYVIQSSQYLFRYQVDVHIFTHFQLLVQPY